MICSGRLLRQWSSTIPETGGVVEVLNQRPLTGGPRLIATHRVNLVGSLAISRECYLKSIKLLLTLLVLFQGTATAGHPKCYSR